MGKGRKVKQILLRFKRVFTRCFPCCGALDVAPDDKIRYTTAAVDGKYVCSACFQSIYIPMTTESLADPELFHSPQILQERFNQLHAPSKYAGNQCTSAALYTLVMRTIKQFATWDRDTMDEVLLKGTVLHEFLRDGIELTSHPDMRESLFDLPELVPVFAGDTCLVARGTDAMVFGQVAREMDDAASLGEEFPKLHHYLQNVLSRDTSILLTIGEYTVAVAMEASRVWLFDSHSRDERGMSEGDFLTGKACLLAFADVDSLVAHLVSVYGRDQYCARSFNFYDLANEPVSPEDHLGLAAYVDEAENSRQIGDAENPSQIGDAETPSQIGDAENPSQIGDAENPSQIGNAENPRQIGDAENPRQIGDAENPRQIGDAENPSQIGDAENPSQIGDAENPRQIGDAENPSQIGDAENPSQIGKGENTNQNAHTCPSQEPGTVVIGGKPSLCNKQESVASAGLSPQTETNRPLPLVLQLLGPTAISAVYWNSVQKYPYSRNIPY